MGAYHLTILFRFSEVSFRSHAEVSVFSTYHKPYSIVHELPFGGVGESGCKF